jgi:rod shape-determining protein MreC
MRSILDTIVFYKEYAVLILCVIVSILLLALNENPQIRSIRSMTIASAGFLQDAFAFIPDYLDLRDENRILREQNLQLSDELSRLREASAENTRLRNLLDLKARTSYGYRAANVVGKNLQLLRNTITLDLGENDGVTTDMPVVAHNGLVGKITTSSSSYSIVQTLFHRDMRVSAKVRRSRTDGILVWDGESSLILKGVARTLDVSDGDEVITSEYSSLFPPGIPIGIVSKTYEAPGDLFKTIRVTPTADVYRLEEVFVLTHRPDTTRVILEQRASR